MRPKRITAACCLLLIAFSARPSSAALSVYTDEASYLAELESREYQAVYESFEVSSAWGSVRSFAGITNSASAVSNLGLTWTSNNASSGVSTSAGAAFDGQWGFYASPHGAAPTIGDGFVATSEAPIYGVSCWVKTNTPPASLSIVLDAGLPSEQLVDLGANSNILDTDFVFFGVIETNGFTRIDYLETEWDPDELKNIFADDFIIGHPVPEPGSTLSIGVGAMFNFALMRIRRPRMTVVHLPASPGSDFQEP